MTVRTIASFPIKGGEEERFETAYRAGGLLQRATAYPGFLGGELIRIDGEATRFVALAHWRSVDDYEAWQAAYGALPVEPLTTVLECLAGPIETSVGDVLETAPPAKETP